MIKSTLRTTLEQDGNVQQKKEETINISREELDQYYKRRDPVGAVINNPVLIWLVVGSILTFTGNIIYSNINGKINGNTEIIETLEKNTSDMQTTQKGIVSALEGVTTRLETIDGTLKEFNGKFFTIETTRFTDKDASVIKDGLSKDDQNLQREIDNLDQRVNTLNDRLTLLAGEVNALKPTVTANSARLNERSDFIEESKSDRRRLKEDVLKLQTQVNMKE